MDPSSCDAFTSPYTGEVRETLRAEFPRQARCPADADPGANPGPEVVYLDNAGSALPSRSQLEAAFRSLSSSAPSGLLCNPHSSAAAREALKAARQRVLDFFHADADEYAVVFNSGTTAGLRTVADAFDWGPAGDEDGTGAGAGTGSVLAMLDESHTSLVGMRELAKARAVCHSREQLESDLESCFPPAGSPSLFAFPAMSNFCGSKFPLDWIRRVRRRPNWHVLLDAAALVSTGPLDLAEVRPDFVCLSFYKMFGYPTGLGALLVRRDAFPLLCRKRYFGGGSVEMSLVRARVHKPRSRREEYFEDGTLPFLQILALEHGFRALERVPGQMEAISGHTFALARHLYRSLRELRHPNGRSVVQVYCSEHAFDDPQRQGGIVTFNLLKDDGSHFGFNAFRRLAETEGLVVRTGCFCNLGACQRYLGFTDRDVVHYNDQGHVCGDDIDMIDGQALGAVRVSFGYYSTVADADKVVGVIKDYFVPAPVTNGPSIGQRNLTRVEKLFVYPIKSCAPMEVEEWPVGPTGFRFDRHWAVMRGEEVMTQKKLKSLCLLRPEIDLAKETLTLHYSSRPPHTVPIGSGKQGKEWNGRLCVGRVCGDAMEARDSCREANSWLEGALGQEGLRLVRLEQRSTSGRGTASLSFANEGQFLVVNRASVSTLAERLLPDSPAPDRGALEARLLGQFRSNIVLGGGDADAFAEDAWQTLDVGRAGLRLARQGECRRCSMIAIDQETGQELRGLVRTLSQMPHRNFAFGVLFRIGGTEGAWGADANPNTVIKVHDAVDVQTGTDS